MNLLAEPTFGPDAEAVADDQHPDHQLGVDGRTTRRAIERLEMLPHLRQIDESVDRPQHVIGRDMLLQTEAVKQRLLHHRPLAHHRPLSRFTAKVNQRSSLPHN